MSLGCHNRNGLARMVLAPSRFPSPRPSPQGRYLFSERSARASRAVFGGVRPSSGAETLGEPEAFGQSDRLELADVAAAEDGRTPLNRYQGRGGILRRLTAGTGAGLAGRAFGQFKTAGRFIASRSAVFAGRAPAKIEAPARCSLSPWERVRGNSRLAAGKTLLSLLCLFVANKA